MKRIKVVLDFIKFPVTEKVNFYRSIIAKLTGNLIYPTPDVSLTAAQVAIDALEAAILAKRDGSHTAVSAMYDAEEAADTIFRTLAAYVERIAAGDETRILSSGFHESKQPILTPKAVLSVTDGAHSGAVKLIAKAVERAGSYIWQYAKDAIPGDDSGWILAGVCTCASFEINGLTVATKYYFRVAAVTPDGAQDFSAPVMKVVV